MIIADDSEPFSADELNELLDSAPMPEP